MCRAVLVSLVTGRCFSHALFTCRWTHVCVLDGSVWPITSPVVYRCQVWQWAWRRHHSQVTERTENEEDQQGDVIAHTDSSPFTTRVRDPLVLYNDVWGFIKGCNWQWGGESLKTSHRVASHSVWRKCIGGGKQGRKEMEQKWEGTAWNKAVKESRRDEVVCGDGSKRDIYCLPVLVLFPECLEK